MISGSVSLKWKDGHVEDRAVMTCLSGYVHYNERPDSYSLNNIEIDSMSDSIKFAEWVSTQLTDCIVCYGGSI